jgi:NAD(P)-dependent dehydrogenase (short-subunit alcohol dehydrogenase family)
VARLDGKVAIVTGAVQGIGLGIAQALADAGAAVMLSGRKDALGDSATREMQERGARCAFVHADVTNEADVRDLIAGTVERFGRIDIVVNNAGVCLVRSVDDSTVAEWDSVMAVNVRSIFLTTKYALPHFRRAGGGCILNIGSVSSFVGQQSTPAYCASKGAVLMLTKSLALDYGPEGIRVNCLCPGITDTPMLRYHVRHAPDPEAHLRRRLERVPLGEMLYPQDMGKAAVFLCSEDAAGITGTSLVVDGGYIACAEFTPPA